MSLKDWTLGGVVVVALLALYVSFTKPPTIVQQLVGAASSPAVIDKCVTIEGVQTCYNKSSFKTATTTVCAFRSPTATSSLITNGSGVKFLVSSTTASTVTLARATTAYATTTLITSAAIAAGAQATVIASTTTNVINGSTIFPPNTYFVVGLQGGTGTFSPTGSCSAVFQVI